MHPDRQATRQCVERVPGIGKVQNGIDLKRLQSVFAYEDYTRIPGRKRVDDFLQGFGLGDIDTVPPSGRDIPTLLLHGAKGSGGIDDEAFAFRHIYGLAINARKRRNGFDPNAVFRDGDFGSLGGKVAGDVECRASAVTETLPISTSKGRAASGATSK